MTKNRLGKKVAVITGGAGEIGCIIAQRFLEEGAGVVLTGRNRERLRAAVVRLEQVNPAFVGRVHELVVDSSDPKALTDAAASLRSRFGRIDILVNNAGTAGPKHRLGEIPLERSDLEELKKKGIEESETLRDAIGSLLGGPWYTTCALVPLLSEGASIINVSTVFSKTEYYGRAAYVVPKAGLNALTRIMAHELGRDARGIRVNAVFPGPVETERIERVFSAMDKLKGMPEGSTRASIFDKMILKHPVTGKLLLTKEEIADTVLFLGSGESSGITGQDFEVTHGLQTARDREARVVARPTLATLDLSGRTVLIIAGDQVEEALSLAHYCSGVGGKPLVTLRDEKEAALAKENSKFKAEFECLPLDPRSTVQWTNLKLLLKKRNASALSVLVLPDSKSMSRRAITASKGKEIDEFLYLEVERSIAIANRLETLFSTSKDQAGGPPSVVFLSNGPEVAGNPYEEIRIATIEQLIRTWRHESTLAGSEADETSPPFFYQLILSENFNDPNFLVMCEWAATLSNGTSTLKAINVVLDPAITRLNEAESELGRWQTMAGGIHRQKVALVTGGSEGIGGEITRQLVLAGARVIIAERSTDKLEHAKKNLIAQLERSGFPEPESRIFVIPGSDVSKEETLVDIVDKATSKFGRVDFLINNAGLVGGEVMAVDMDLATWNQTLYGNLISNYYLLQRTLPVMKKVGRGHVINMSSYFGGSRHGVVPYTNRSDYATSKAGQQALVEMLAPFVGPEVQINAVAPGPVDGARLNGTYNRPGLYARRSRLILEHKRLNFVHSAVVAAQSAGNDILKVLGELARNKMEALANDKFVSDSVRHVAKILIFHHSKDGGGASTHLLNKRLFELMLRRLRNAGILTEKVSDSELTSSFVDCPEQFFDDAHLEKGANSLRRNMLMQMASGKMPTDRVLAVEVVESLAHESMSGEILYPTSGLHVQGHNGLEGGFRYDGRKIVRLSEEVLPIDSGRFEGEVTLMLGDSMFEEMAAVAKEYSRLKSDTGRGLKKLVVLTLSDRGHEEMLGRLKERLDPSFLVLERAKIGVGESPMDYAVKKFGSFGITLSFPTERLPKSSRSGKISAESLPSTEEFSALIQGNLTNHFLVGRQAALFTGCRIFFITPGIREGSSPMESALIHFIRKSLRAFTLAAGKESGHICSRPIFHQVECDNELEEFVNILVRYSMRPESI